MQVGSAISESIVGHRCDHGRAIGLLKHARPPNRAGCFGFKMWRVSSTQRSSDDDESICTFVSKSNCYGTSATLPVLERNREMAKPQKMELFVVAIVLAEFGPACIVSAGGMCHRFWGCAPGLTSACAHYF